MSLAQNFIVNLEQIVANKYKTGLKKPAFLAIKDPIQKVYEIKGHPKGMYKSRLIDGSNVMIEFEYSYGASKLFEESKPKDGDIILVSDIDKREDPKSNNTKSSMAEEAFKKHEIVPDVISSPPKQTIKVEYEGDHEVNLGAELTPRQVKDQPKVIWEPENDALYTLAMIDPDASSLTDANRIEVEHWLVVNIPGNDIEKGETLSDYYGAGPPKDTGLHRYIFFLFKQPGKIAEPKREGATFEELVKQRIRPIKKLIETHNLGAPVAGNFFQAEFDDYVTERRKAMGRE